MGLGELSISDWHPGASLRALANLPRSPLSASDGDRQLDYVARYIEKLVTHSAAVRCTLVEPHYIDRDFLEDCGAFYVHNLKPLDNYCTRIHFFACDAATLKERLQEIRSSLRAVDRDSYRKRCDALSKEFYLGFTVIRPLPGCPIGRTVLRCHPANASSGYVRLMSVTRDYRAHVGGVTLTVLGLAFQQQDRAVSACATVAIWSAFHRLRETDDIATPSPSKITKLATQFALPFGRSMPAGDGLNISQMCVAIEQLQMSPALSSFSSDDHEACKQSIWSAVESGYPPILILERLGTVDERLPESRRLQKTGGRGSGFHAVTVTGVKQTQQSLTELTPFEQIITSGMPLNLYRVGQRVTAVYIHDDRIGPYRRADFIDAASAKRTLPYDVDYVCKSPSLKIRCQSHSDRPIFEYWAVRYLLLPLHPRIRTALIDLDRFALRVCKDVIVPLIAAFNAAQDFPSDERPGNILYFDYWIERGHEYQERMLGTPEFGDDIATRLADSVGLPRHVGVMRFVSGDPAKASIDVVLDTTSNVPNEHFLLVIPSDSTVAITIATAIAELLACRCLN